LEAKNFQFFLLKFTAFHFQLCHQWSISPTFYKPICANILVSIKSLTFTASTKKLLVKLLYEKAARKIPVKLAQEKRLMKHKVGNESETNSS
jgi:hypothetical protein